MTVEMFLSLIRSSIAAWSILPFTNSWAPAFLANASPWSVVTDAITWYPLSLKAPITLLPSEVPEMTHTLDVILGPVPPGGYHALIEDEGLGVADDDSG